MAFLILMALSKLVKKVFLGMIKISKKFIKRNLIKKDKILIYEF